MPNVKEMQFAQRKLLVKYLRLEKLHPDNAVLKELINDTIAEMDEEDVALVQNRLFEERKKQ